jgi:hypothetical protein
VFGNHILKYGRRIPSFGAGQRLKALLAIGCFLSNVQIS